MYSEFISWSSTVRTGSNSCVFVFRKDTETKRDSSSYLKIMPKLCGASNEFREIKRIEFKMRSIANDCVARIETYNGPVGWIEFEHSPQVGGEVRFPSYAGVGNGHTQK